MKEKFTKGPWDLLPAEESKEYLRVRGATLGGRYKIANVLDLQSHHDGSEWCKREVEESIANAKLISCAPDMYEMLESKLDLIRCGIGANYSGNPKENPKYLEVVELLERARGEYV